MTSQGATKAVTIGAAITLGSVSAESLKKAQLPPARALVAGLLAFAALGVVAEVAPDVGGGLAIAVSTTAFVTYALPIILVVFPDTGTVEGAATTSAPSRVHSQRA